MSFFHCYDQPLQKGVVLSAFWTPLQGAGGEDLDIRAARFLGLSTGRTENSPDTVIAFSYFVSIC